VTLHGLHLVRRVDGIRKSAASLNLRLLLRAASRTICVSNAELESVRSIVGPGTLERVAVIRNGVTTQSPVTAEERETARAAIGVDLDAVVGAWVGSLDGRKDPLTPVLAARDAAVPVTILVAGDGPLRSAVERWASPRVRVLGFRDDVRQVLAASDFFVLSSEREGLSFALLEAMALGLVPLVTDAPENLEAVGHAGLKAGFGDVDAFAAAMTLLAGDESQRRLLGLQAQARVEQIFRADEMIDRTRAVYDDVSRSRDGASGSRRR
jgi:glycosyltransferase involved in cell wall biosynthesis